MAIAIGDTWTEWRIEGSPLSEDEDYLTTQNVAGFLSVVKPKLIKPLQNERGIVDIVLRFFDGTGDLVLPNQNTNVDLTFIEVVDLPPNPGDAFTPNKFLQQVGSQVVGLNGDGRATGVTSIAFNMLIGCCITGVNQIPTFTKMGIFARFA